MSKKFKLSIVIDGESAEELFAVGPIDLRDYFLPNNLNVKSKDVVHIVFQEVLNEDEFSEYLFGERTRAVHSDNYYREKEVKENE